MRFLRACGIGLITGLVGLFLAIFSSDYLTQLDHVSDMEGQRGMAVLFLFGPLGFIVGFLVGLLVALSTRWPGFFGFIKTLGLSVLGTCALAGIVSGLGYLAADKPPVIDGKRLTLDFELRLPPAIQLPAELTTSNVHASLYANNRGNRAAEIDLKSIGQREGAVIIPGSAVLMSRSANRSLLASIEGQQGATQFIPLKLPGAPGKEDAVWSDWIFATERADLSAVPQPERIAVRYRVRPVD
jgi:hypothetical protein